MTDLITNSEIEQRLSGIKKSFKLLYGIDFEDSRKKVNVGDVIPTQPFLEKEKLQMVIQKVINENYSVPIILMEHRGKLYIIDGHHRAYTSFILGNMEMDAIILKFPDDRDYKTVKEIRVGDMKVKMFKKKRSSGEIETSEESAEIIKMWEKAAKTALHFEKIHNIEFSIVSKEIKTEDILPTQKMVDINKTDRLINKDVPIICIEHNQKFYVIDGHNRAFVSKKQGIPRIKSLILVPEKPVDFGIIKTAEKWGVRNLEDLIPK
jgi:hypothetical protein